MTRLVDALGERIIGTVERVAADSFTVAVDVDAPHATALNTGTPERFPRVNGYLIVPHSGGATVGIVSSVRIERSSFPKRKGLKDFDLVDLPFPQRVVVVTPIGTLQRRYVEGSDHQLVMERGVDVFPSVGDAVHLPGPDQLTAIVGAADEAAVPIGRCPLADGLEIRVDPDRLFGRHLAVLGNTGSGKSCSVAGLIRWSVEAAVAKAGRWRGRVVVLDPNGEYGSTFEDLPADVRVYRVTPKDGEEQLRVPAWLWNADEWASFTRAAPGVQRPILVDALQRARGAGDAFRADDQNVGALLVTLFAMVTEARRSGSFRPKGNNNREAFAELLRSFHRDLRGAVATARGDDALRAALQQVASLIDTTERSHRQGPKDKDKDPDDCWHSAFDDCEVAAVQEQVEAILRSSGSTVTTRVDEHAPVKMDVRALRHLIDLGSRMSNIRNADQHASSLLLRVEMLLAQERLRAVAVPDIEPTLAEWLTEHLASSEPERRRGSIVVLDLSLLPSEVTHTVASVTCRMVFEALQRHRRLLGSLLPTCLVIEEAHTFAHARLGTDGASAPAQHCSETIEKIAREGRKFGLGMVLSSQRPSELSATVLSQCNTFLLHRIVNDRDQDQVRRLVPDGLGEVLRELPSLPTRRAVLLGWATPAPVVVEMRALDEKHRPRSSDPDFWQAWTEPPDSQRTVDWQAVADEWVAGATIGGDGSPDDEASDGAEQDAGEQRAAVEDDLPF
ncbi:MAG: ATP-binding protein [Deltaproteobacteria bacterium]|nr:ATP-binding protein [Deltaproteobacteria bacterium]